MEFFNIKHLISKKSRLGLILPGLNISLFSPIFLLIHITLRCNKRCAWCYQSNSKFYADKNKDMPTDAFKDMLRSFKYFRPHIHLYGGEPLLHQEFPLFLEYARLYGYKPTLTTNSDYLDRYSTLITQSSLSQLNISLNGIVDSRGNFDKYLQKNINKFIYLNKKRKIVNLNYVIEPESVNYLADLAIYLNKNFEKGDFSFFIIQHLNLIQGNGAHKSNLDLVKLKNIVSSLKIMKLKYKILYLPDINIDDLQLYYHSEYQFKNKCYVPWLGLNIYPDLSVTPGGGIFACNQILGNLKQNSILDIWKGRELKQFRLKLIKEELPMICNRCCHKQYY